MKNFFKKFLMVIGGLFVILFIIGLFVGNDTKKEEQTVKIEKSEEKKEEKPNVPTEYLSALAKAEMYANNMFMSKDALYEQLTSSAGEGFPKEAAKWAIENVKADWKANALEKAKSYQENMHMSRKAIHAQLTARAGEKFTKEEADWALENLPK